MVKRRRQICGLHLGNPDKDDKRAGGQSLGASETEGAKYPQSLRVAWGSRIKDLA